MKAIRNTRQRQAVLNVVRRAHNHPDAAWIFDQVRAELPQISLGTVYRALDTLVAQGELLRLSGTPGATRYDVPHPQHHHFVCDRCGTILDVDLHLPDMGDLQGQLPAGVRLSGATLMLSGLCATCAASDPRADTLN